jgi:alkylated DNA repair protein alkB family protein 6
MRYMNTLQPHEDGPSYHPVVATISMGTHTVFNYYRYKDDASTHEDVKQLVEHADEGMPRSTAANTDVAQGGRAIDPKPVLSMLLEPRSLVITTSSLYTKHLHGIEPLTVDHFAKHEISKEGEGEESHTEGIVEGSLHDEPLDQPGTRTISNWQQVESQNIQSALSEGGSVARGVRLSLTCRDVERVVRYGRNAHLGRLH